MDNNNLTLSMLGCMSMGFDDEKTANVYAKVVFSYRYRYDVENIWHYGNGVCELTQEMANNNTIEDIRHSILHRLEKDLSPHAFANLADLSISIYCNPKFKKVGNNNEDDEYWKNGVCCNQR